MRAAYYEKNGPARDVLPVWRGRAPRAGSRRGAGPGASPGVNPSDAQGARRLRFRPIAFPRVIPHSDGAGEIDMVGEGVAATRVGERVWTWNGQWKRPFGTCAEYVVLPAALAVLLPAHVGMEVGACLGIPAMTAHRAVEVAGSAPGATVLVAGGAGAVGHYAIQFAKQKGATVLTTVSSPEKAALARAAGADHTIDYRRENVGERVMELTQKRGVDAVIELDLTTNAKFLPGVLHARSKVVIYGTGPEATIPSQFLLVNGITLQYIFVYELTKAERERTVSDITRMLEQKTLINNVALTLPLSDIVAAHEVVEQGKMLGNVVVKI